jgi:hypothetical protein
MHISALVHPPKVTAAAAAAAAAAAPAVLRLGQVPPAGSLSCDAALPVLCQLCGTVSSVDLDDGLTALAEAKRGEAEQEQRPCDNSCGRTAKVACNTCPETVFCQECFEEAHKMAAFKKHVAVPLAAAAAMPSFRCGEHPDQSLLLACLEPGCRRLLCTLCANSEAHEGHKKRNFADAAKALKDELAADAKTLEPLLRSTFALQAELSQRATSLESESAAVIAILAEAFRELSAGLDRQRDALMTRVRTSVLAIAAQATGIEALAKSGPALVAAGRAAQPTATVEDLDASLRAGRQLRDHIAALRAVAGCAVDQTVASFQLDRDAVTRALSGAGTLKLPAPIGNAGSGCVCVAERSALMRARVTGGAPTAAVKCEVTGAGIERLVAGVPTQLQIVARDSNGVRRGAGGDVFTVTMRVAGSANELKADVADKGDGSYSASYTVPLRPEGDRCTVSVCLKGVHVAGSPFTVPVALPFLRVEVLRRFGAEGTGNGQFQSPAGIAIGPDNQVFVCDVTRSCIQVFRPTGAFVRTMGTPGAADGQLSYPLGLCFAGDEVFISDHSNHRIQVWSLDGVFKRKFGSLGASDGMLNGPYGIAVSPAGEVFVVEYGNNRVQVFAKDGRFIRRFGEGGLLHKPTGAFLAANGDIYVANLHHNIVVFASADGTLKRKFGVEGTNDGQVRSRALHHHAHVS